jgi:hypothetical protein
LNVLHTSINNLIIELQDILKELRMMPLLIEIQSQKNKKSLLEEQLSETEQGIKMFSRKTVYIRTEDYENL